MPAQRMHAAQQVVPVAAPAAFVYRLLADARRWPLLMPRYVHVERIDFDGVEERLWAWELACDRVRRTQVSRVLDPHTWSIDFEQHDAARPGGSAAGRWSVEPLGRERSLLTLHQHYRGPHSLDAAPAAQLEWIRRAGEHWEEANELLLCFEERVHVRGPADLVCGFLQRVGEWTGKPAHVVRAKAREYQPGVQLTTVETDVGPAGPHPATIETLWLSFPHAGRIVHKDLRAPAPIAARTGEWSLEPDRDGVTATVSHQVLLRPQAVRTAPAQLRRTVREWLCSGTAETVALAERHAQDTLRRRR